MSVNRALITGIQGFCGRHLAAHLLKCGYQVWGVDRASEPPVPGATTLAADILHPAALRPILAELRPTHLFHLAALTSPTAGWEALHDVNVLGTDRLLQALREAGSDPVVLLTGSSAVYGRVRPDELPIAESQPLRPATLYAVSKVAQEMLAYSHYARYGTRLIRVRAFNLTGPGEGPAFVTSAFARQLAEIELGEAHRTALDRTALDRIAARPVLHVGNLDAVRDFTDVRDAVRAYRQAAEWGTPGEVYNVCSGTGTPVRRVLDLLLELTLLAAVVDVRLDPARLQPADVPIQVGDASRLAAATGWRPHIHLRDTLADLLDAWRLRVRLPGQPPAARP